MKRLIIVDLIPYLLKSIFPSNLPGREIGRRAAEQISRLDGEVICVTDSRKSVRKREDATYKEHRGLPNDIKERLAEAYKTAVILLDQLGIKTLIAEGFEADDLIAEICRQNRDREKVIISADKDLYALLDENTMLVWNDKFTTEETFREKYGIPPKLFPTVLALAGDYSDNIKGVKGIGIKTALKIVKEVGDKVERKLSPDQLQEFKRAWEMVRLRKPDAIKTIKVVEERK